MPDNNEIILYTTIDGLTRLECRFDSETLWLSLNQIAELFDRDKSVISKHLKNIFEDAELERDSVVANHATTAADGKSYQVDFYNLEAIFAVGYRVRSPRGAQFRKWAPRITPLELLLALFQDISTVITNTRAVPLVLKENAHKGRVFFCPNFRGPWQGAVT